MGHAIAYLLYMSMNVAMWLCPSLDGVLMGPMVSLEIVWPACGTWWIVGWCGPEYSLPSRHVVHVSCVLGGIFKADRAGNI